MVKFALLRYLSEFRLRVTIVLIIGNSKSNHLGAQGTFNPRQVNPRITCITRASNVFGVGAIHPKGAPHYNADPLSTCSGCVLLLLGLSTVVGEMVNISRRIHRGDFRDLVSRTISGLGVSQI